MSDQNVTLSKEELQFGDVRAAFLAEGRLIRIGEIGHEAVFLEIDEAKALRDWLNTVLSCTWKQLQKRATGDDGVDIEVMIKRQAKRIQDLERENNSLRLALQSATEG